ncbi:MAG: penicillin-binding protein 1A [Bacteriovoracaceae bacterium]
MKTFIRLIIGLIMLAVAGVLTLVGLFMYVSMDLPQISSLADYQPPVASQILSQDGKILLELYTEKREIAKMEEIPRRVIDAFLSAEDDNFYNHQGVDYMGVVRAMFANLRAGRVVQGGSTITQQVAKSLLLSKERSVTRKIKDFLLAQRIEKKLKKDEILYLYLNQVYLGGGYHGVKTAFRGYFNKELKEATVAEAALVAGLLVAPGKYSPYINPQFAKTRQNYVLKRMYETKKITKEEYETALKESIRLIAREVTQPVGRYFTDWVRGRLMDKFGVDKILNDGFKIVTTLDYNLQKKAEEEVLRGLRDLDKRQGFAGPIRNIPSDDLIKVYEEKYKKDFIASKSMYFDFKPGGHIVYELSIQNESKLDFDNLNGLSSKVPNGMLLGNILQDSFLKSLKVGEIVEAVVKSVDDGNKLIFLSIGGASAVIPFDHFKWAHERYTDEIPKYFAPVSKPSTIVEKGDVVFVSIINTNGSGYEEMDADSKKKLKDSKVIEFLKRQKYIIAGLEQEPMVQGALLSMEPGTGKIITMVGGSDFEKYKFNHAIQAERQPGSCFKPIIYGVALENGYTPASILIDSPQALAGADDVLAWKPKNYDGEFKGPITFRRSLEESRNVTTIKLAEDVGIKKITEFAHRFGIKAKLAPDLSLALGSFGITLMDLVQTYAIFPNGGRKIHYKSIVTIKDKNGNSFNLDENIELAKKDDSKVVSEERNAFLQNLGGLQVYDPRLAYLMVNVLKGVITSGTATAARGLSSNIAGKTGTTNNYVDAWFTGFSPNLVTGVWVGFDNNKPIGYGETGGRSALPIWIGYMKDALKKYGEREFAVPEGIVSVAINKETGKLARATDKTIVEIFAQGTEPGSSAPINATGEEPPVPGKVILDDEDYYQNQ